MKKATMIGALIGVLCIGSFAQAEDKVDNKAPSTILQGTAVYGDMDGSTTFPYLETGENPSGGNLELVYRANLYNQVILLGFHFDLGANKEKLEVNDLKLKTNLGFGIGPTCRVNYGVLHAEAGVSVGVRGYVFGYVPNAMDENANGYAMASWGMSGNTFLRFGVGPFFVGGSFGLENPMGGEPGELKPAVEYEEPTLDDLVGVDINNASLDDAGLDTNNLGKVSRESGRTRVNGGLLMGFWF